MEEFPRRWGGEATSSRSSPFARLPTRRQSAGTAAGEVEEGGSRRRWGWRGRLRLGSPVRAARACPLPGSQARGGFLSRRSRGLGASHALLSLAPEGVPFFLASASPRHLTHSLAPSQPQTHTRLNRNGTRRRGRGGEPRKYRENTKLAVFRAFPSLLLPDQTTREPGPPAQNAIFHSLAISSLFPHLIKAFCKRG